MTKQVLIAGCGDIGTQLGLRLCCEGHAVWGLRRHTETLPACIQPVACDLTAADLPGHLPQKITDVVYTAAATERSDQAYADAYVRGLDNLLNSLALTDQPIDRIVFTSSTAVYGQSDGQWVNEQSVTEPAGFPGRRLLEAEQRLHDSPYPASVVRLAGIYGPNRTRLLSRVRNQQVRCPSTVRYTNRIHRDDCVAALAHVLRLRRPDPVYLAADHDPADIREVLRWLADALGVPLADDATASGPPHPDRNKRCSNDRLVGSGFTFEYSSYRDGYGPILDELSSRD